MILGMGACSIGFATALLSDQNTAKQRLPRAMLRLADLDMRIAFISDIHGHLQALEAVLADISRSNVQSVVCLGDVISLGLQPREVIEVLQEIECQCVMGNHDEPFVDDARMAMLCVVSEEVYRLNMWTAGQVSEEDLDFMRGFQQAIGIQAERGRKLLCFHGTPRCSHEGIFPETPDESLRAHLQGHTETIFVGGHTHRQMIREEAGRLVVNPGSVGSVFEEPSPGQAPLLRPWAEYGIMDLSGAAVSFELKKVPFDLQALHAAVARTDIPYRDWWVKQYPQSTGGSRSRG